MKAKAGKRNGKMYALVAVAVVVAFVLYKRNKASSVSATDQAVPLTPSSYFYPGSGASYSSGGGTAGSSSGNVGQPAPGKSRAGAGRSGGVDTGNKPTQTPGGRPPKPIGFR